MNIERVHHILDMVKKDLTRTNIVAVLGELADHLQQQVNNLADTNAQNNVSNSRKEVIEALAKSKMDQFSPSWMKFLEEVNLPNLISSNLLLNIEICFTGNEITPALVLEGVKKIHEEINEDIKNIESILDGFEYLVIGKESLEPGGCEIGVTIPREYVNDNLKELGKEIAEVENLFLPFAELATGSAQNFRIRSISSSEFQILFELINDNLQLSALTTTTIAVAIKAVINVYKDVQEVRSMKGKFKAMKAPKSLDRELTKFVERRVNQGIEKAIDQLVENHSKVKSAGRNNELKTHLKMNLKEIAKRLDRGFDVETRMGELPPPKRVEVEGEEGEVAEEDAHIEFRKSYSLIQDSYAEQQNFEREGEPILSLPEPSYPEDEK